MISGRQELFVLQTTSGEANHFPIGLHLLHKHITKLYDGKHVSFLTLSLLVVSIRRSSIPHTTAPRFCIFFNRTSSFSRSPSHTSSIVHDSCIHMQEHVDKFEAESCISSLNIISDEVHSQIHRERISYRRLNFHGW